MTDAPLTIEHVDWQSARAELLAVRFAVFVDEQGVPAELEQDAADATALHLLGTDAQGRPVATARMLGNGHIGRMAVVSGWRRRGIGSRMLRRLIEAARDSGLNAVFLHAQCRAVPFYERLGFVAEGAVFDDAGIPHRCMRLDLNK